MVHKMENHEMYVSFSPPVLLVLGCVPECIVWT